MKSSLNYPLQSDDGCPKFAALRILTAILFFPVHFPTDPTLYRYVKKTAARRKPASGRMFWSKKYNLFNRLKIRSEPAELCNIVATDRGRSGRSGRFRDE
jgi:hypothetical protein